MVKAKELVEKKDFSGAEPILENNFRLLNKVLEIVQGNLFRWQTVFSSGLYRPLSCSFICPLPTAWLLRSPSRIAKRGAMGGHSAPSLRGGVRQRLVGALHSPASYLHESLVALGPQQGNSRDENKRLATTGNQDERGCRPSTGRRLARNQTFQSINSSYSVINY